MKYEGFYGYIELFAGLGVVPLSIEPNDDEDFPVSVYMNDGDFYDNIVGKKDLLQYGENFYLNLSDYNINPPLTIDDVWPE